MKQISKTVIDILQAKIFPSKYVEPDNLDVVKWEKKLLTWFSFCCVHFLKQLNLKALLQFGLTIIYFLTLGNSAEWSFNFIVLWTEKNCAIILNLLKQIFLGTVLQLNTEQISDVATKVCVVYNIS